MARIRTVKPEFWQDETIGELSAKARLLFLCSLNLADDEGLLSWNSAFLRAQAFMFDDVTLEEMESCMKELSESQIIFEYQDQKNKKYGWIINFRKHQKIDRPQKAKHPVPSLQNPKVREAYAIRDGHICHICGQQVIPRDNQQNTYLSMDHLNPRSNGGGDEPSNIKIAHQGCNASKGDFVDYSTNDQRDFAAGKERKGTGKGKERNRDQGKELMPSKLDMTAESEILNFLNKRSGKSFQPVESNLKLIRARLKEGHTEHVILSVVERKIKQWENDQKMAQYIRPATLFNAEKFNQYVGEIGVETPDEKRERELAEWANEGVVYEQ